MGSITNKASVHAHTYTLPPSLCPPIFSTLPQSPAFFPLSISHTSHVPCTPQLFQGPSSYSHFKMFIKFFPQTLRSHFMAVLHFTISNFQPLYSVILCSNFQFPATCLYYSIIRLQILLIWDSNINSFWYSSWQSFWGSMYVHHHPLYIFCCLENIFLYYQTVCCCEKHKGWLDNVHCPMSSKCFQWNPKHS